MPTGTDNLGECRMVVIRPFNSGNNAIMMMKLKNPVTLGDNRTTHVGVVLEEAQLLEMIDGLNDLAVMREAARSADRMIKLQ